MASRHRTVVNRAQRITLFFYLVTNRRKGQELVAIGKHTYRATLDPESGKPGHHHSKQGTREEQMAKVPIHVRGRTRTRCASAPPDNRLSPSHYHSPVFQPRPPLAPPPTHSPSPALQPEIPITDDTVTPPNEPLTFPDSDEDIDNGSEDNDDDTPSTPDLPHQE